MDYERFQPQAAQDTSLQKIAVAASEMARLTREQERLERESKQVADQLKKLAEEVLPDLMDAANGTTRWEGNGLGIKIDEMITANCPVPSTRDPELQKRRSRLFKWLDDHNYGRIINRELKLIFDRSDEELARQVEDELKSKNLNVARQYGIHPQTLSKFVRDCLADGVDIPEDVFGVHRRRVAKLDFKK